MSGQDHAGADATLLSDRVEVRLPDGREVTVWNRLYVGQYHDVGPEAVETNHRILVGDGSTGESPEFITPAMEDHLESLDLYPDAEVVDPTDEEVDVL